MTYIKMFVFFLIHVSDVHCPEEMVYRKCSQKLDDFCHGGCLIYLNLYTFQSPNYRLWNCLSASVWIVSMSYCLVVLLCRVRVPGRLLEELREGCFCPRGQLRAGKHSKACVSDCSCEYQDLCWSFSLAIFTITPSPELFYARDHGY